MDHPNYAETSGKESDEEVKKEMGGFYSSDSEGEESETSESDGIDLGEDKEFEESILENNSDDDDFLNDDTTESDSSQDAVITGDDDSLDSDSEPEAELISDPVPNTAPLTWDKLLAKLNYRSAPIGTDQHRSAPIRIRRKRRRMSDSDRDEDDPEWKEDSE